MALGLGTIGCVQSDIERLVNECARSIVVFVIRGIFEHREEE